jgi:hypothetical protein
MTRSGASSKWSTTGTLPALPLPIYCKRVRSLMSVDSRIVPHPLRLGGERPGEGTGQRGQQEAATVHARRVLGLAARAVHPNSRRLLQPVRHAHLAVNRRRCGEVLLGLISP